METRQRKVLVNGNRILILVLTVAALSMDGIQHSDLPGSLAVLVWLWADAWLRVEAKILAVVRRAHPDRESRQPPARKAGVSSFTCRTVAWWASLAALALMLPATAHAKFLQQTFKRVNPATVEIRAVQRSIPLRPGMIPNNVRVVGSGVLIRPTAVLTASHVVEVADRVSVLFVDGQERAAMVVASEPFADVSLLSLSAPVQNIRPARLGDSNEVEIGEQIFVIGAPYGISHTLTVGFVSGRHHTEVGSGFDMGELLQTDAAINQGNSGGPMFNVDGEVIGIVSHIQTTTDAFVGLGFAVSIHTAKALVIEQRSFWSGVQSLLLPPALARALNVSQGTGMLVQQVARGSPAERLGLRPGELPIDVDGQRVVVGGDVILAVNGIRIDSVEAAQRIRESLISFGPAQEMTVEVLRSGYRERLSIPFQTASVE